MIRLAVALLATLGSIIYAMDIPPEHELLGPITVPTVPSVTPTTTTTTTTTTAPAPIVTTAAVIRVDTTTTTIPGIDSAKCPEWWPLAIDAGWTVERLPVLDDIMYDESRCQPDIVSPTNDYGLLQLNRKTWRTYVESFGLEWQLTILPAVNLYFGAQIAAKAVDAGWRWCSPWDMSEVRPC